MKISAIQLYQDCVNKNKIIKLRTYPQQKLWPQYYKSTSDQIKKSIQNISEQTHQINKKSQQNQKQMKNKLKLMQQEYQRLQKQVDYFCTQMNLNNDQEIKQAASSNFFFQAFSLINQYIVGFTPNIQNQEKKLIFTHIDQRMPHKNSIKLQYKVESLSIQDNLLAISQKNKSYIYDISNKKYIKLIVTPVHQSNIIYNYLQNQIFYTFTQQFILRIYKLKTKELSAIKKLPSKYIYINKGYLYYSQGKSIFRLYLKQQVKQQVIQEKPLLFPLLKLSNHLAIFKGFACTIQNIFKKQKYQQYLFSQQELGQQAQIYAKLYPQGLFLAALGQKVIYKYKQKEGNVTHTLKRCTWLQWVQKETLILCDDKGNIQLISNFLQTIK